MRRAAAAGAGAEMLLTRSRWSCSEFSNVNKDALGVCRGGVKTGRAGVQSVCSSSSSGAGGAAGAGESFDSIPGPTALPFIGVLPHAHFLPSIGVFHNVACPALAERLRAQYGELVRLGTAADLTEEGARRRPATPSAARPLRRPTLFLYRPRDILQVYEYESASIECPHFRRGSPLEACRSLPTENASASASETETNRHVHYKSAKVTVDGGGGGGGRGGVDVGGGCGISRVSVPAPPRRCEPALEHITDRLVHRLVRVAGGSGGGQVPEDELEEAMYAWALETAACAALDACVGVGAAPPALVQIARAVFAGGYLQRHERTLRPHRQHYRDAVHTLAAHTQWCELWLQLLGREGTSNAASALSDVLLAAVDPLVHTALRLMYHLALNPAKRQRLRDCGGGGADAYAAACVRESLRLHTVTGACAVRRSTAWLLLAGHLVPPGVDLALMHHSASRSEREFGRASSFVPERWTCERSEPLHAAHAHVAASRPWGSSCPGRQLAERALAALLTRLLARHDIEWHGARGDLRTDALHYMPPPYRFVLLPT